MLPMPTFELFTAIWDESHELNLRRGVPSTDFFPPCFGRTHFCAVINLHKASPAHILASIHSAAACCCDCLLCSNRQQTRPCGRYLATLLVPFAQQNFPEGCKEGCGVRMGVGLGGQSCRHAENRCPLSPLSTTGVLLSNCFLSPDQ